MNTQHVVFILAGIVAMAIFVPLLIGFMTA